MQGLRGIAVLLVVLYHGGLHVPGGFTGVDVFFVISGWVITSSLVPELRVEGRVALLRFYGRRIRRLLPALALLLVVVALVGTLAAPVSSQRTGALTGLWASAFAANAFLFRVGTGYFNAGASLDPLLHTWTLAVEEQFYVVFPTLLAIGWRLRRARGAAAAVALLSAASFAAAIVLGGGPDDPTTAGRFAFYGSPTRAWEFGAGALLALAPWVPGARWRELSGVAGLVAIVYAGLRFDGTAAVPGWETLFPVLGACAVIAARGSLPSRLLSVAPLVWIGDLSYSWYLWHWPAIVFARAFVPGAGAWAAAASLFPAWLSYRYVEQPFRTSPRLRGNATLAVGLACVLVPAVASAGLVEVQKRLARTTAVERWNAANELHADVQNGCDDATPLGERVGTRWRRCRWPVLHPKGTVYLVGDSNAGHFTEGFVAGANEAGYTAVVAAYAGCPFIDLRVGGTVVGASRCRTFDRKSLDWLVRAKPSLVVIANRADGFIDVRSKRLAPPGNKRFTSSSSAKRRLWESGLSRTLARFVPENVPVEVVHPVPQIDTLNDACAVVLALYDGCEASVSRGHAERGRADALAAERAAVRAASPWAEAVDFAEVFCDGSRCSSVRHGEIVYADRDHLSVAGSRVLATRFAALVRTRARHEPAFGTTS